jgi:hypothetical protein
VLGLKGHRAEVLFLNFPEVKKRRRNQHGHCGPLEETIKRRFEQSVVQELRGITAMSEGFTEEVMLEWGLEGWIEA